MVRALTCLASAVVFAGNAAEPSESIGKLTLVERGPAPRCTIVLPADPSPSQTFAALELRKYVREMTDVTLPIATNATPACGIFLGNGDASLGNDGFRLRSTPPHFRIEGSRVHGTLFGVYDFLERYCGCEWFLPSFTVVPKCDRICVPARLDDVQRPAFLLRDLDSTEQWCNAGFSAKLKLNGFRIPFTEELGGYDQMRDTDVSGAVFDSLCPSKKYFKDHPDWFSMIGGERRPDNSQRCCTNKGFLDFMANQMKERIKKNYPRCKYYAIYPNDKEHNYCRCPECSDLDKREESHSASLMHLVNYVAEAVSKEHPDIYILTFAYSYSVKPPKTMKLHPNVAICISSGYCDFSKPFLESRFHRSREFVEYFRKWRKLTDKMFVWDYAANFKHPFLPFESSHNMQSNFRFFKEMGAISVYEEGFRKMAKPVDEALKTWLSGHLLWNPDQPVEPLLQRFFKGYYGAAEKVARAYYDALINLENNRDETKAPLVSWGWGLHDKYLPTEFFDEWSAKWTAALDLVKDDAARRENVYWARHNVDLVRIARSKLVLRSLAVGIPDGLKREHAALKPVAERMLADFSRVKELNGCRGCNLQLIQQAERIMKIGLPPPDASDIRITVPAAELRTEEAVATMRIRDPMTGKAAFRMLPFAPGEMRPCISYSEDLFLKDPGAKIGIRVHARVEKTGVANGTAFSVGTCGNAKGAKRDIRDYHVGIDQVKGDGYQWYDVEGTWTPAGGEKLWICNGKRVNGVNPCVKAVYIDQIELLRK